MAPDEFYTLVRKMREAQRRYFRDRRPADVETSKALERQVDAAIRDHDAPPGLFDREVRHADA